MRALKLQLLVLFSHISKKVKKEITEVKNEKRKTEQSSKKTA